MDLSRYWQIVKEQWLVFVIAFVVTVALTSAMALRQADVYEASGTFVVRPRTAEDTVRAIDTLNRSVEIGATYAFIARSELIEERARQRLEGSRSGLRVGADLVAGTNVIEIWVTGGDPERVAALAVAVGEETVAYIGDLQDAFELSPLDSATVPARPSGPNRSLTVSLGAVLGAALGALLALGAQMLQEGRRRLPKSDVTDAFTGVYSEAYFRERFRREALRAKRRRRPFSLALFKVVTESPSQATAPPEGVLRQVAAMLHAQVGKGEALAYLGEGIFSVLMPGHDVYRTERQAKQWRKEIEAQQFGEPEAPVFVKVSVGAGSFGHEDAEFPEDALSVLL